MGVYDNISMSKFPKQGSFAGKRVKVIFHYKTDEFILGRFVRDDVEARIRGDHKSEPISIIALDDGRYVLTTECQYSIMDDDDIDNPESLTADLADSPYNGLAKPTVPFNGMHWYHVDMSDNQKAVSREVYEKKLAKENEEYRKLAQQYGGEDIYGDHEGSTGEFFGSSLLMPRDFDPKTQEKLRGPDGRFAPNKFKYSIRIIDDEHRYVGFPLYKIRKEFRDALATIEDDMVISRRSFAEYIAAMQNNAIGGFDEDDIEIVGVGNDVWLGIPEYYTALKNELLVKVPYSDVVLAQEQDIFQRSLG